MVNYKKKTAKKRRTTSNPTQTEKRTTGGFLWLVFSVSLYPNFFNYKF